MKEDPVLPTPRKLGAVPWTGPYKQPKELPCTST